MSTRTVPSQKGKKHDFDKIYVLRMNVFDLVRGWAQKTAGIEKKQRKKEGNSIQINN